MRIGIGKYFSAGTFALSVHGNPENRCTSPPGNLAAYSLTRLAGYPNDGGHRPGSSVVGSSARNPHLRLAATFDDSPRPGGEVL